MMLRRRLDYSWGCGQYPACFMLWHIHYTLLSTSHDTYTETAIMWQLPASEL